MAKQCDQTSDNGFPHDNSHAKDWSSERSSKNEDTTELHVHKHACVRSLTGYVFRFHYVINLKGFVM